MEIKRGDANRITREYFDSLLIEMRHIDAVLPSTEFELFGEIFSTPIMTAALSHLDHFGYHKDGMVELAKGAKAANAVMWAGMGSENELERILATGAKTIKIVKPEADNDIILKKIAHAENKGCIAVGIDLDHAFNHKGEYDEIENMPMHPKSLDEVKKFVESTKLPFIIKGVLSVTDALKCLEAGVQCIVVSHHHGIMDYAAPPLMVLPKIVKAVGGKMKIFVDCGIESGYDAFKAIALGAQAVSAGRSILEPLREKGGEGVCEAIKTQTTQLAAAMARTSFATITEIDSSVICKEPRYFS
ncbi:MAG: alpha-hydroxy-acid oxidizing protein [Defluviitaleaceae bacterium]|nr:alpha-hydroxy-acid oxidizing protein [Defluviitaleaceae bacterium]